MKIITLDHPAQLPDRPLLCYFATDAEDAIIQYQEKYKRVPKAVYSVEYPRRMSIMKQVDTFILAEV